MWFHNINELDYQQYKKLAYIYQTHYDECTNCKRKFVGKDKAYLGLESDGKAAFVCERCADRLSTVCQQDSWYMRPYSIPDINTKLWRYIDVNKFEDLLRTKSLFFTRASFFNDEGVIGIKSNISKLDDKLRAEGKDKLRSLRNHGALLNPEKSIDQMSTEQVDRYHTAVKYNRENTFICCWHMNNYETDTMWKAYQADVVIQTTYERLLNAIDDRNVELNIGKVNYLDRSDDNVESNHIWFKRPEYRLENEVRAVLGDIQVNDELHGVKRPVDINELIESIYISPNANDEIREKLTSITEECSLGDRLKSSSMSVELSC